MVYDYPIIRFASKARHARGEAWPWRSRQTRRDRQLLGHEPTPGRAPRQAAADSADPGETVAEIRRRPRLFAARLAQFGPRLEAGLVAAARSGNAPAAIVFPAVGLVSWPGRTVSLLAGDTLRPAEKTFSATRIVLVSALDPISAADFGLGLNAA